MSEQGDKARKALHDMRWGPHVDDPVERQEIMDDAIKVALGTVAALEARLSKMDELESERDMLRTVLNDTDKAELLEALEQSTKEALTLRERVEELEEQYGDLLLTVVTKHEDETRHETARRYIFEAENRPAREALAGGE